MNRTAIIVPLLLLFCSACGSSGPKNEAPTATATTIATYMSTAATGQLEGEDADGDPLTFAVASPPASGQLELMSNGAFRYVPDAKASGADSFTFLVNDGKLDSEVAEVDIAIATLTDGTLDTDFGSSGVITEDFAGGAQSFRSASALSDGTMVFVGQAGGWLLAGYTADGELNPSFESGGYNIIDASVGYDALYGVQQQSTGRMIAVGQSQNGDRDFAVYGFTALGVADSSFGQSGIVLSDLSVGGDDVANALVLLPDDRILAAGYAANKFAVARYTADGELDSTFGVGGVFAVDFPGSERANSVLVDSSGKVVLAGEVDSSGGDAAFARLGPNGDLDANFGSGGTQTVDLGAYEDATDIVLGPDGSLYACGYYEDNGGSGGVVLYKLDDSGQPDAAFGEAGHIELTLPGLDNAYPSAMIMLPNQTLLIAGSAKQSSVGVAFVARVLLDGALDASFADEGLFVGSYGTNPSFEGLSLADDGKVVVVGQTTGSDLDGLVIRLGW